MQKLAYFPLSPYKFLCSTSNKTASVYDTSYDNFCHINLHYISISIENESKIYIFDSPQEMNQYKLPTKMCIYIFSPEKTSINKNKGKWKGNEMEYIYILLEFHIHHLTTKKEEDEKWRNFYQC